MPTCRSALMLVRKHWQVMVIIALFGSSASLIYYRVHVDPLPDDGDLWEPVMAAYPNGGVDCHVAVVDRVVHVSDLLRKSPYVDDDLLAYEAERQANELALDMVLGEDAIPPPPECGGWAGGEEGR